MSESREKVDESVKPITDQEEHVEDHEEQKEQAIVPQSDFDEANAIVEFSSRAILFQLSVNMHWHMLCEGIVGIIRDLMGVSTLYGYRCQVDKPGPECEEPDFALCLKAIICGGMSLTQFTPDTDLMSYLFEVQYFGIDVKYLVRFHTLEAAQKFRVVFELAVSKNPPPAGFGTSSLTAAKDEKDRFKKEKEKEQELEAESEQESEDEDLIPVISLPALLALVTGEDNQEILFMQRAKLLRYVTDSNEWKEYALGIMQILRDIIDPKKVHLQMSLEMLVDDLYVVWGNQRITSDTKFEYVLDHKEAIAWISMHDEVDILRNLVLCIRFKKADICEEFLKTIKMAQKGLKEETEEEPDKQQEKPTKQAILDAEYGLDLSPSCSSKIKPKQQSEGDDKKEQEHEQEQEQKQKQKQKQKQEEELEEARKNAVIEVLEDLFKGLRTVGQEMAREKEEKAQKEKASKDEAKKEESKASANLTWAEALKLPKPTFKVTAKPVKENETETVELLFEIPATLFRIHYGEWQERARVQVQIKRFVERKEVRVVVHQKEPTFEVCLDHVVTPKVSYNQVDGHTWMFDVRDSSKTVLELLKLRFDHKDGSKNFLAAMTAAIEGTAAEPIQGEAAAVIEPIEPNVVVTADGVKATQLFGCYATYYDFEKNTLTWIEPGCGGNLIVIQRERPGMPVTYHVIMHHKQSDKLLVNTKITSDTLVVHEVDTLVLVGINLVDAEGNASTTGTEKNLGFIFANLEMVPEFISTVNGCIKRAIDE